MGKVVDLWVVTDGRAGHAAQSFALAEAIGRLRPTAIQEKPIQLKKWAAMVPPVLSETLGASRKGWPFSGLAEGAEALHWPWPDIVIGTGRRAAPVIAAIRRLHGVAAVQILDPRMRAHAFDALIVPEHDALAGANVLKTVGALSRVTRQMIAEEGALWAARLGTLKRPRLAVLVGGSSGAATFGAGDQRQLLLVLQNLAAQHGLMITVSRRTPQDFADHLKTEFGADALVWTGEGDNPYPAILGLADAVLVTKDSVNMASEAASTGLPVHVFPLGNVAPKIAAFHEALQAHGASRPFTGEIGRWSYPPLAEADRIAADLVRRGVI